MVIFTSGLEQTEKQVPVPQKSSKGTLIECDAKGRITLTPEIARKLLSPQTKEEYSNDSQDAIAKGNTKYDGGKSPIYRGALSYFPRAISAVATVSAFGASKYAWKGWEGVDDGYNRYSDAMVRHLGYEAEGEDVDPDSGLLHAAHTAWNALARLELLLKDKAKNG